MSEPCTHEKGHFDGGSFFLGVVIGVGLFLFCIFVPLWQTRDKPKGNEILWRTETGVTCRVDELYPKASCSALLQGLGPRLSNVKVAR